MDKISVVVTAYNIEKYISECLNSIANQTYSNLDVIVIDDGSIDETYKICKKYEKKDNRFKVFTKKNGGPSEARNFGLKKINGEYFLFVDGDDVLDIRTIDCLYKMIKSTNANISICEFEKFYDNYSDTEKELSYELYSPREYIYDLLCFKRNTYTWGVLYNKEFKDIISFPKDKYFEDMAVMYKIFSISKKICHTDLQLVKYRQVKTSIVHTYNQKKIDDFILYFEEMCDYYGKLFPEYDKLINRYICNSYMNCLFMSIGLDNKDNKVKYKKKIKQKIKDCNLSDLQQELKLKFILYKISPKFGYFVQVIKRKIKR